MLRYLAALILAVSVFLMTLIGVPERYACYRNGHAHRYICSNLVPHFSRHPHALSHP